MADAPSKQAKFWSSTGMSTKHDSLVPGVNDVGNRRPKAKVKGGKTREVKASVPVLQPVVVETTDTHGKKTSSGPMSSDISTLGTDISTLHARDVTLKDLCTEDKKRIANLIKELAKVGEEKESAELNLSEERQHYQQQIMALVQQQEAILKEREDVQNRLLEYQSYIVKLQQQQQLQHLQQHQEQHRQNRPRPHKQSPVLATDGNTNQNVSNKQDHHPCFLQPESTDDDDDDEGLTIEQPSAHLYINESMEQSAFTDGLSTHVLPSQSPPPQPATDSLRSRPQRPFTTMIDKQLYKERRKAETVETLKLKEAGSDYKEAIDPEMLKHMTDVPEGHQSKRAEKYRRKDGANDDAVVQVKNQETRTAERLVDNNNAEKEKFPEPHPVSLGASVSPEKAELFSRFMESQSRSRKSGGDLDKMDVRQTRNDGDENDPKKKKMSGRKERRKGVRPPPPSFGGFYPPIMSSTQKSSEIGDYVSNVDSSIASDLKERNKDIKDEKRIDDDGKSSRNEKYAGKVNRNNNAQCDDCHSAVTADGVKISETSRKSRVDFLESVMDSSMDMDRQGDVDLGVDKDFLCYYKKLSASERKQELLKQRAVLLEEQDKLRKLLTRQQQHHSKRQQIVGKHGEEHSGKKEVGKESRMEGMRKEQSPTNRIKNAARDDLESRGLNTDLDADVIVSGHGLKRGRQLANKEGQNSPAGEIGDAGTRTKATSGESQGRTTGDGMEVKDGVTLRGRDGEECVTYVSHAKHSGKKRADNLVKKLDYSLVSDTEEDEQLSPSNLDRKFVMTPTGSHNILLDTDPSAGLAVNSVPSAEKSGGTKMVASPLPVMVDAGTSISFATVPSHDRDISDDHKTGGAGLRKTTNQKETEKRPRKPCFSESPGDKTLAVLKIINSLPEESSFQPPLERKFPPSHNSNTTSAKKKSNITRSNILKHNSNNNTLLKDFDMEAMAKRNLFDLGDTQGQRKSTSVNRLSLTKPFSKTLHGQVRSEDVFDKRRRFPLVDERKIDRKKFAARSNVDSELDVFAFVGWKDDRMDGYRKIMSGRNDDKNSDNDNDTFYDYDDKDDSNIDDIVEGLLSSGVEDVDADVDDDDDRISRNDEVEDEVWDSVIRRLNPIPKIKSDARISRLKNIERGTELLSDLNDLLSSDGINNDDDDDSEEEEDDDEYGVHTHKSKALGKLSQKSKVRPTKGDWEESSILEDIFFVTHS